MGLRCFLSLRTTSVWLPHFFVARQGACALITDSRRAFSSSPSLFQRKENSSYAFSLVINSNAAIAVCRLWTLVTVAPRCLDDQPNQMHPFGNTSSCVLSCLPRRCIFVSRQDSSGQTFRVASTFISPSASISSRLFPEPTREQTSLAKA